MCSEHWHAILLTLPQQTPQNTGWPHFSTGSCPLIPIGWLSIKAMCSFYWLVRWKANLWDEVWTQACDWLGDNVIWLIFSRAGWGQKLNRARKAFQRWTGEQMETRRVHLSPCSPDGGPGSLTHPKPAKERWSERQPNNNGFNNYSYC